MEIIASFTLVQEDAGRPLIVHEIWSQYTSFMTKDEMESRCSTTTAWNGITILWRAWWQPLQRVGLHPVPDRPGGECLSTTMLAWKCRRIASQCRKDNRERIQSVVLRIYANLSQSLYLQDEKSLYKLCPRINFVTVWTLSRINFVPV